MKRKKINFNFSEEFSTNINNPSKENLMKIFNKKYFNYIQKITNMDLNINE